MSTDCLVLRIDEMDERPAETLIDTCLYVLWDTAKQEYFICGKRAKRDGLKKPFKEYRFCSRSSSTVVEFIKLTTSNCDGMSITLYNMNDLPGQIDDITHQCLIARSKVAYEVYGQDNYEYRKITMLSLVKMLRGIRNDYVDSSSGCDESE